MRKPNQYVETLRGIYMEKTVTRTGDLLEAHGCIPDVVIDEWEKGLDSATILRSADEVAEQEHIQRPDKAYDEPKNNCEDRRVGSFIARPSPVRGSEAGISYS